MPIAKVERYNGEPTIMIDGVPFPPMTITTPIRDSGYLKKLGESGLKIYYVVTSTRWNDPGDPDSFEAKGIEKTMAALEILMEAVPDAYVILRLNVSPPLEWVNAHPEEQLTYSDGSHEPVICTTVSRKPIDGMHSLCSDAWRRDGDTALSEYFDELEKSQYFNRIIGFFLCAGGTSEWYYPQRLEKENGAYGDFSEPFRKEYERFYAKSIRLWIACVTRGNARTRPSSAR